MMVCLEKAEEMPAHAWEVEQAVEEGVRVRTSWGPKRVVKGVNGEVKAVEFMRCTAVFDENNRFNPRYDACDLQVLDADAVIFAIGQAPDASFIDVADIRTERGLVKTDGYLMTDMKGVFACGEAVKTPGSVIDAIADGRKAASCIDSYLGGEGDIYFELYEKKPPDAELGRREGFAAEARPDMRAVPPDERYGFTVVNLGYGEDAAKHEAGRCLQCDLRLHIEAPVLPPEHMLPFTEENVGNTRDCEGAFILYDETKQIYMIKGTARVKDDLTANLGNDGARFFAVEEDAMYTKKESELIQSYLQVHGQMPPGNSGDLDDLF